MLKDQIIEGFRVSINQLIPGTEVTVFSEIPNEIKTAGLYKDDSSFARIDDFTIFLWFNDVLKSKIYLKIQRNIIQISHYEEMILKSIPELMNNFQDIHSEEFLKFLLKLSSKISFDDLLIAKFLNQQQNKQSKGQLDLILVLQELTFRRYEGQKCTSGFVFTEEIEEFKSKVESTRYRFFEFDKKAELTHSFFSTPATYRYVDGRNSFYLIDNRRHIHGILRLKNPDSFSLVDRIGNRHLKELLEDMPGNSWISFVGLKDEVYIIVGENQQLKWSNNHWHFRNREIILSLLEKFGLNNGLDKLLVNVIFSLSEIKYGSIILMPEDDNILPPIIGKIDQSTIGMSLRNSIQSTSMLELASSNSILGILSSDGLTTISKKGSILSCGDIIDINKAAQKKIQGGGRSQAAIASSYFGIALKISQDGPISFYYKGEKLIEL